MGLIAIAIVGFFIYETAKPLSDSVTPEYLKEQTASANDFILAKIEDEYYQTGASVELSRIPKKHALS